MVDIPQKNVKSTGNKFAKWHCDWKSFFQLFEKKIFLQLIGEFLEILASILEYCRFFSDKGHTLKFCFKCGNVLNSTVDGTLM